MNLADCVTREDRNFTVVGIYGILTVLKEGSDVTNPDAYLWIELGHLLIPTNMKKSSPFAVQMPGAIIFTGIQFLLEYGPYRENRCDNYVVSYQGAKYLFEIGKNGKLASVILK